MAESADKAATSEPGRFSTEKAMLILFDSGSIACIALPPHQKEACKVLRIVLDIGRENLRAIVLGRRCTGDPCHFEVAQLGKLLHASRRVVKSDRLHQRMLGQKSPALRQCDGMGVHAANTVGRRARQGDQIVPDAEKRLAFHLHIVGQKQVEVLQNRPREAVLDRNSGRIDFSRPQRGKHLGGKRAGNNFSFRSQPLRRFVAERSGLPLNGNFHSVVGLSGRCVNCSDAISHHTTQRGMSRSVLTHVFSRLIDASTDPLRQSRKTPSQ